MRVHRLRIFGFRGIERADLVVSSGCVMVGPNGCGKSTVVDALSLVLGRPRMVRPLTENDFAGGDPHPGARLRILATLVGFDPDSAGHSEWFRMGRGVPKWLDANGVETATETVGSQLCATIGFAARFDHDTLEVETTRYFHDDDAVVDPFVEEGAVNLVPQRLVNEVGYFVLPARRTWDAVASFNSDLFRRTVSNSAGIPATAILSQRDRLRRPADRIEDAPELKLLAGALNAQLARLILGAPRFQLRVTAGDSEAVLQALLPHYEGATGPSLPASRHGSGLLSLQSLLLLLEVGRSRRRKGQSFILALEEPELHLAPGIEGRLVADALHVADQVVCTTHSPEVARRFQLPTTLVLSNVGRVVEGRPLLATELTPAAQMWERRFYGQSRAKVIDALMRPFVLIPEGRLDTEWLARLSSVADREVANSPPFPSVFGLIPTEDAQVTATVQRLRSLRGGIIALVDGDGAGDGYAAELLGLPVPPDAVIQWPHGWSVEDAVVWVLEGGGGPLLADLQAALPHLAFTSFAELGIVLRTENDKKKGTHGIKQDLICHDTIASTMEQHAAAVTRAAELCNALVSVALREPNGRMSKLPASTPAAPHFRFMQRVRA